MSLPWPDGCWREDLANAVTDLDELLSAVGLSRQQMGLTGKADEAARSFRLRVPRSYVGRMQRGDPGDPLLRQVLPTCAEVEVAPGFSRDPLSEVDGFQGASLLQKYQGRGLVLTTAACAIHCRYCFRRHFPGDLIGDLDSALDIIADDPSLHEVILSGGDPLVMPNRRFEELVEAASCIAHVRRIRIHTRLPVVLPQRVDGGLLTILDACPLQKVIVLHANHANEVSEDVRLACSALGETGATMLNQAVLLAGINDSVPALAELSEKLFLAGVLPYYLHVLDPVAGAAHFDVPEGRARRLFADLCAALPGYLVPRLVREVPGLPAKLLLAPDFDSNGVEDW